MLTQPDWEARSPWSTHNDKLEVKINPPKFAVNGTIRVPGSKSLTNRALLMASLAEGTSVLEGILKSDDSYWCIDALNKLGVHVRVEGDRAAVTGCDGQWPNSPGELYVGSAGTVARFLPGALAIGSGEWRLNGSKRMRERPLSPLLRVLTQLGARFEYLQEHECLPFILRAEGLRGGRVSLPGSTSSQFISGLLIAAPYAVEQVTVHIEGEVVQKDYVQMTMDMMSAFGVTPEVSLDGQTIIIPQGNTRRDRYSLNPTFQHAAISGQLRL